MKMIVKTIQTSPKWVGENWKTCLSIAGTIWTIIVVLSTWLAAVNASVKDVNEKIKPGMKTMRGEIANLGGKMDVLITLEGYRVMGKNQEAREYLKSLPPATAPNVP